MSQQHPTFSTHPPRGAVAASAITLPKNTTVLRASPAIQIPAAPSVPSVSVSVAGLPGALGRNPVISAIRPTTPPSTRAPSPAVSMTDHSSRANLLVQGGHAATNPMPVTPLQITLTQRVNPGGPAVGMVNPGAPTVGISEAIKLGPLTGKTVQVAQPGLLQHQKVGAPAGSIAGMGMASQLQQQAVLAASKPGGTLQVTANVPAISISSLSGTPMPAATAMAPTSASIPIAKVTPQRQQIPLTPGIPASIALQTITSGAEFTTSDLSAMATQAGANQLLLSQTARNQPGTVVTATTGATLSNTIPTAVTSLALQHGERALAPAMFNLTAAASGTAGAGQDVWLSPFVYHNPARAQALMSTPANTAPIIRTPNTNTFFVPRPGAEQPRLISLTATNTVQPGIHASLIAASTAASQADSFSSSSSLHMAASLASGNTGVSVLSPNLGLTTISNLASRATVASSIIAAASAHQVQPQAPSVPSGSTTATTTANTGASPRPSILRKRTIDGSVVPPRKPNFNLMAESHSPRPDTAPPSNISSPKTPATENSQSSTDTALSSNDAPTPTQATQGEGKVKIEPDGGENGPSAASPVISDASPRKRARKQLFDVSHRTATEEMKGNSSSEEDMDCKNLAKDVKKERTPPQRNEYIDEEGVRWTRERTKPSMSIMNDYAVNWKPRLNHFQRHTDVRPKEDRNPTVNEIIGQRGIVQTASGWRLYYVSSQIDDVIDNEKNMEERMEALKQKLAAKATPRADYDYNKLLELTRGSIQRCQVIRQQMTEAKTNLLSLLRHEPKIKEIIQKNLAKRTIKKKERT